MSALPAVARAGHEDPLVPVCSTAIPPLTRSTTDLWVMSHGENGLPLRSTLYLPVGASTTTPVPMLMGAHDGANTRAQLAPRVDPTTRAPNFSERLLRAGYALFTWDTRGHGSSRAPGVEGNFGHREFEGNDARALVDYLSRCGALQQDGPGDPRVGMFGASNGGGVQLVAAIFDSRIDAITPRQACVDLRNVAWLLQKGFYMGVEVTTGSDLFAEGPAPVAPFKVRIDSVTVTLPEAPPVTC